MALAEQPLQIYSRPKLDGDSARNASDSPEPLNEGEHRWMIDKKRLGAMLKANNRDTFLSGKFELCRLWWILEAYPNGNTKNNVGSFSVFLKLVQMPGAFKSVTILRHFKSPQTHSAYVAVDTYKLGTSLAWPDYTLALSDLKARTQWLECT